MSKLKIFKLIFLNIVFGSIVGYCMYIGILNKGVADDLIALTGLGGAMAYFGAETKWIFNDYKDNKKSSKVV